MSKQICKMVSDKIIAMLERGTVPWQMPWILVTNSAVSYSTLKEYSLVNQFLCGCRPGEYATYKQVKAAGGYVKKGAKASQIVFWNVTYKDEHGKYHDGSELTAEEKRDCQSYASMRYYNVFNIEEDCEGVEPKRKEELNKDIEEDRNAEDIIKAYLDREGIKIKRDEKSNRAFYDIKNDTITVPLLAQFRSQAEFYSAIFHEITHSTGNPKRLNRFDEDKKLELEERSLEELVAEIGACALANYAGVDTEEAFQNSASYIDGWKKAIADDNNLVITAARQAEKAIAFILGSDEENSEEAEEEEN